MRAVGRVGHEDDAFDVAKRAFRGFDEGFAQLVLRLVDARRIEKNDLKIAVENARVRLRVLDVRVVVGFFFDFRRELVPIFDKIARRGFANALCRYR